MCDCALGIASLTCSEAVSGNKHGPSSYLTVQFFFTHLPRTQNIATDASGLSARLSGIIYPPAQVTGNNFPRSPGHYPPGVVAQDAVWFIQDSLFIVGSCPAWHLL